MNLKRHFQKEVPFLRAFYKGMQQILHCLSTIITSSKVKY